MHFPFRQTSAAMPFVFAATFLLSACLHATASPQEEKEAESNITSVALFKNGLSVVRLEVLIPNPGIYRLSDVPEPVHGTFLVNFAKLPSTVNCDSATIVRLTFG